MPKAKEKTIGEHKVVYRFVRVTARKCRLIVDMIRGMDADQALELLKKDTHRSTYFVRKLMTSAIAGAVEKNMNGTLVVSTAKVDEGPTIKWFQPRAQGRAYSILKRTSHIVLGLRIKEEK